MSAPTATTTPAWLLQGELALCPCGCIGKRKKGSFVEKTLTGGAAVMQRAMFGDDTAAHAGLLQSLDARVKLVTLLGLLVTASVVQHTVVLVGLYALTLGFAVASRLNLAFFIKRVWLFIPIFTGIVVLPATLNIITEGTIVIPLGNWWFGQPVGVTSQGLQAAALIVTRVAVSISLVVLLTLTTPWAKLMSALRALFVPRVFIQVIGMAYRYIFYLLGSVEEMYTARKSRLVSVDVVGHSDRTFVSATAGALFGKAHGMTDEVHLAMVSRGYTGDARSIETFRVGAAEVAWTIACVVIAATAIGVDHVIAR